jgi:hypothetical protein
MTDRRGEMGDAGQPDPASDPLGFFTCAHRQFSDLVAGPRRNQHRLASLPERAFDLFASGVARHVDDLEGVACHGGCASCCTIRVIATAPEILVVARTIRSAPRVMEVELMRRIAIADRSTRQLDEAQRLEEGVVCPFVDRGLCVIYSVRTLACRGHASFDSQACIDALAGHPCEVPVSTLHMTVRSLVQNAMQSALRDGGYAWGVYELNQALNIALSDEACEAAWGAGKDVFAPALVADVSCDEMAATFDAIKAQARGA